MSALHCIREAETARAARAGVAPPELCEHLRACGICHEVFAVASSLGAFADSGPSEPLALAPGRIWWKAEIAKERAAAREAMTAVRAIEVGGPVVGACALAGWIAWNWSAVSAALSGWTSSAGSTGPVASASYLSVLVTLAASAVTLAVAGLALRPFLVQHEE